MVPYLGVMVTHSGSTCPRLDSNDLALVHGLITKLVL